MIIPFLSLKASVAELRPQFDAAYARVMDRGQFILGEEGESFEAAFADYCEAAHAVGVGSGLGALTLMLLAFDIGGDDEVIVPANTHIATWLAVSATGARVVPVEPDPTTFNIDPAGVEAAITPRTAAILAVHLYGQSADMTRLRAIAGRHGLALVVDAAQAAGARHAGSRGGIIGDAAAFSFYPTKNLGALGDGGAVVTADGALADKVRKLRNYGSLTRNVHELLGQNCRLDELQAAFLHCRLTRLETWNDRRRALAARYLQRLAGLDAIRMPTVDPAAEPVWHLFTVQVAGGRRDDLMRYLAAAGIGTGIYYPVPPHMSDAYAQSRGCFPPLPVTQKLAQSVMSLPLHPHLGTAETDRVSEVVCEWALSNR
jgi:dTDP-4-amino-4,6-dideoxygalactose transaminase